MGIDDEKTGEYMAMTRGPGCLPFDLRAYEAGNHGGGRQLGRPFSYAWGGALKVGIG